MQPSPALGIHCARQSYRAAFHTASSTASASLDSLLMLPAKHLGIYRRRTKMNGLKKLSCKVSDGTEQQKLHFTSKTSFLILVSKSSAPLDDPSDSPSYAGTVQRRGQVKTLIQMKHEAHFEHQSIQQLAHEVSASCQWQEKSRAAHSFSSCSHKNGSSEAAHLHRHCSRSIFNPNIAFQRQDIY